MTKRLAIVTAVQTALKLIKTAGGYNTQLPDANIYIWHLNAVPFQTYFANIKHVQDSRNYSGGYNEEAEIEIDLVVQGTYTQLTSLMHDVDKAIYTYKPSGFEAWHVRPGQCDINAQIEDRVIYSATMRFSILHRITEKWEPESGSF